jgi:Flp pilus assembly protein TadG
MTRNRRNGIGLIYSVVILLALTAIASLAVDFGRVELVKTQLRCAADAAARAAAHDMTVNGTSSARDTAVYYAKANKADGTPVILDRTNDIEFGNWDTAARKFTVSNSSDPTQLNAVHVTTRRIAARNTAVPLMFASLIGAANCDVKAETVVMIIPALNVNQNVPATADPFLSGMPAGSEASNVNPHNNPDYAGTPSNPRQSPIAVSMAISNGGQYTFDSITGDARHDPGLSYANPDGDTSEQIGHNNLTVNQSGNYDSQMYNSNGIADAWIPINSLVGVFLDDNAPNKTDAPANLDFRDPTKRDFTMLQPKLKQLFYIGDGTNSAGIKQTFVAPPGATRLFLATMDYYEWNNNAGFRNIQVNRPERIILVK